MASNVVTMRVVIDREREIFEEQQRSKEECRIRDTAQQLRSMTGTSPENDSAQLMQMLERFMQAHEIDVSRWEFNRAPQLSGRALLAYVAPKDAIAVKAVIRYHEVETFRNRFNGLHFTTLEQSLIEF